MGEVATMFDVNPSLIRFWEKEFNIEIQKKNQKGNRLFSQKEIEKFNKIYILVKIEGFTLEGAKKALKQKSSETATSTQSHQTSQEAVLAKLEGIKEKLLRLKG
jgi:DNA-binding transcriptional MerR regulator